MTERVKPTLQLDPSSETALFLSALKDTRARTLQELGSITNEQVDTVPPGGGSTIGAVLYHIAIVEADWLFDEILGTIETDFPRELFPAEMREDGTLLSPFTGESLDQHRARLEATRSMLTRVIEPMSSEDLHTVRERAHYDVSPAWVLHHLMQHEAEHRSQLIAIHESLA